MRNKELKSKRGITLIALVITIVVLLILAGITINLLFADGGILKKAGDAKDIWKDAETSDITAISGLASKIDELVKGTGGISGDGTGEVIETPGCKPLVFSMKMQGEFMYLYDVFDLNDIWSVAYTNYANDSQIIFLPDFGPDALNFTPGES